MQTLKYIGLGIGGVGVLLLAFYLALNIWGSWHDEWSGYNWNTQWAISDGWCNIAVLPIEGDITTERIPEEGSEYPMTNVDEVAQFMMRVEDDPNILATLVRIDSYGGYPVASEIASNAVKKSGKPTVSLIREAAISGGYMVASAANNIIASAMSDVGGIGVTMSYVGNWEKNTTDGLTFVPLASAPFKDYGNPEKPLTEAERAILERDLKLGHEHFVKMVAENRNLPVEEVAALADGSSMPGVLALENKLIDQLGDQDTARSWFASELKIPFEDVLFCE